MSKPESICIIPARGGSKRIPGKNLRLLGGRSLLQRAVESAVGAGVFDEVIVSSDDPAVKLATAELDSVTFHDRASELANDTARVPEVVHKFLSDIPETDRPKTVGVILPPCPFRTDAHVKEAYERFKKENHAGFLVSITSYDFPPQFAVKWADNESNGQPHALDLVYPEVYETTTRSQSVAPRWHPNGAVYLCNVNAFLESMSFFSKPLIGYEMSPEDSLDIDWPHQFEMAEAMVAAKRQS